MREITFNNLKFADMGNYRMYISTEPAYTLPQRDIELTHVNGRNGDILWDSGSFQNYEKRYNVTIPIIAGGCIGDALTQLNRWLYSATGYCVLKDNYDTTHYWMALIDPNAGIEVSNFQSEAIELELVFNCRPQRFLQTDGTVRLPTSGKVEPSQSASTDTFEKPSNPNREFAYPKLKLVANTTTSFVGTITINGAVITISSGFRCYYGGGTIIDCETMTATGSLSDGTAVDYSKYIYCDVFPTLKQNAPNSISISNTSGPNVHMDVNGGFWDI